MTMERPDKSVSRYDKSWQEYADSLEQKLEYQDGEVKYERQMRMAFQKNSEEYRQKLERITKRLEEIAIDGGERYSKAPLTAIARQELAQQLVNELKQ